MNPDNLLITLDLDLSLLWDAISSIKKGNNLFIKSDFRSSFHTVQLKFEAYKVENCHNPPGTIYKISNKDRKRILAEYAEGRYLSSTDIDLVMSQTDVDRNRVIDALIKNHGDIVNAIMALSM